MTNGGAARYRILRRLGHGGMAEVFEAELAGELGFSRKVAIKRMLGDAAALGGAAQRFLDEARIASKLHHANIVSVLDVGLLDGMPFQVLELVDGITAQQLAQHAGGTLPLPIALIVCGDVAHALDHAHVARDASGVPLGIVHRDVKPANVLVSWGGDVKLSDFGIAVARDRFAQTEAGVVAGTAGYIAPEQRTRSELDGRTDVFALGLTLHALVTGYTPLKELAVEVAAIGGVPIPLDPSLPDDVRAMIARAVAPRRLDRPSAAQLADAIGAALAPRLTRDARGYLRDFLGSFKADRPAPGVFDRLLGVEVVLTAQPADAPARYELRPTAIAEVATVRAGKPRDQVPPRRSPNPAPPSSVRSRRRTVVLAFAGVAIAGGVTAWQLAANAGGGPANAEVGASAGAPPAPPRHDSNAPGSGSAVVPTPAPHADVAAADPRSGSAVATPRTAAPARDGSHPRDRRRAPLDVAASPPAGTGWLQAIGGEALIGAKVLVDGQEFGYVPNPIEVQLGHHSVELVTRDNARLPAHAVDITAFHTQGKPLKTSW